MRKVAAIFIITTIISFGCKTTKYVPEGEYLLDEVTIVTDNKEIKEKDVKPFVKQKANTSGVGKLKMRLWLYNLAPKNGEGWLSRSLKKAGKAPVIFDENYTKKSEKEIKKYLSNKGFTKAEVDTKIEIQEKKRKAIVTYSLTCNTPYRIEQSTRIIPDTTIAKIITQHSDETLLQKGELFDLDVLDAERARITKTLKDQGYYDFTKENFRFQVDTTLGDYKVKDIMILKVDSTNPNHSYKQYTLNQLNFIVGYDAQKALKDVDSYLQNMDTVKYKGINFLSEGEAPIKPDILFKNTHLKPGEMYSKAHSDFTHSQLSGIKIIRYVNISYQEQDSSTLDCNVYISVGEPQTFSFDVEGTNVSGNFGANATAGYAHNNLFRGAEQFSTQVSSGVEAIIGLGDNNVYYSKELGIDLKLVYPKFIFNLGKNESTKRLNSQTEISTSLDYQERPEYSRYIGTANIMYNWDRSNKINYQFTPIMFNYVNVDMTDAFAERIDTTEYLKYSYDDHVIIGGRFAISFQGKENAYTSKYLRLQLETSGNMMQGFNSLTSRQKEDLDGDNSTTDDQYYNLLDVRYAQYAKIDLTHVLSRHLNENNTLAYRLQIGLGVPYGNSSQLPFEKRYFGGGANGVRAWMIRSLGPGSYYNDAVDYFNQSGDINLIASLEYRFKMFGPFEGALFADAGNVWSIFEYESQPGALFEFDNFYKQIALGTGVGIRLDLNFFVFRLDMAYKVHDPTRPMGERWVLGEELGPTTHIAIGYPF